MKRLFTIITVLTAALCAMAQGKTVQNRPYTDLRPFHFGVVVGMHLQDIEFMNVGPQIITGADGTTAEKVITCDQDRWDPGFTVGVLGEFRLSNNFAFRIAPAMYFGNRHITLTNLTDKLENGEYVTQRQDLKTVYISSALNLLFSAPRLNNTRPYLMAGINPMINLSGKDNDYIKLKRYDVFLEFVRSRTCPRAERRGRTCTPTPTARGSSTSCTALSARQRTAPTAKRAATTCRAKASSTNST